MMTTTTALADDTGKPERRPVDRRLDRDRPRTPYTAHIKEFAMPDGRPLLADRRALAFIVEGKPSDFGGKPVVILAFRTSAKGCPVVASYEVVKRWWLGTPPAEGNGKTA